VYLFFVLQSDKKSHRVDRPSLMNTEGKEEGGRLEAWREREKELAGERKIRGKR